MGVTGSILLLRTELEQQLPGLDLPSDRCQHVGDTAGAFSINSCFHFHRFDRQKFLSFAHGVAGRDRHADDQARQGRRDLVGIGRIGHEGFADR